MTQGSRPSDGRREALRLAEGEVMGGKSGAPLVSNFFPVERYCAAADKVLASFQEAYDEKRLDDAYVLGKRFARFSLDALPTHNYYKSPKNSKWRLKNQNDMTRVIKQLEQVVKWMDEEEFYIQKQREKERRAYEELQRKIMEQRRKEEAEARIQQQKAEAEARIQRKKAEAASVEQSALSKLQNLANFTIATESSSSGLLDEFDSSSMGSDMALSGDKGRSGHSSWNSERGREEDGLMKENGQVSPYNRSSQMGTTGSRLPLPRTDSDEATAPRSPYSQPRRSSGLVRASSNESGRSSRRLDEEEDRERRRQRRPSVDDSDSSSRRSTKPASSLEAALEQLKEKRAVSGDVGRGSSRYPLSVEDDSSRRGSSRYPLKLDEGPLPPPVLPPPTSSRSNGYMPPPPSYNQVVSEPRANDQPMRLHHMASIAAPAGGAHAVRRGDTVPYSSSVEPLSVQYLDREAERRPKPPVRPQRIPMRKLREMCLSEVRRLKQDKKIQVFPLGTYQGRNPSSTNGCTVISPLVVSHHLRSSGSVSDSAIVEVIDRQCPPILRAIRNKLGLEGDALIIPSDVHDYLVDHKILSQSNFSGANGGNILDKDHIGEFLKILNSGENGDKKNKRTGAALFFHEHVVSIVKVPVSQGKFCFDLVDSLPTFSDGNGNRRASRTRCRDLTAFEALLRSYACAKFSESNCKYIDQNEWDEAMADFDPRVFQAFVWAE